MPALSGVSRSASARRLPPARFNGGSGVRSLPSWAPKLEAGAPSSAASALVGVCPSDPRPRHRPPCPPLSEGPPPGCRPDIPLTRTRASPAAWAARDEGRCSATSRPASALRTRRTWPPTPAASPRRGRDGSARGQQVRTGGGGLRHPPQQVGLSQDVTDLSQNGLSQNGLSQNGYEWLFFRSWLVIGYWSLVGSWLLVLGWS